MTEETELKRIADVLDGTTGTGPLVDSVAQLTLIAADIDTMKSDLALIKTDIDTLATEAGLQSIDIDTIATQAAAIEATLNALETATGLIETAINTIVVDVAVSNSDVLTTVNERTSLVETGAVRRDSRARTAASRSPSKPGNF